MNTRLQDFSHDAIDAGRSIAALIKSYDAVDEGASYASIFDKREELYLPFTLGVGKSLFAMAHELLRIEGQMKKYADNHPKGDPS
jgi:hypothetical protein